MYKSLIGEHHLTFAVLCPDNNIGMLRSSRSSIAAYHPTSPILAVTSKQTVKADVAEMETFCPTYRGGNTISSLLDEGLKRAKTPWVIFFVAGNWYKPGVFRRLKCSIKSEHDILFPVIDRKWVFDEATIHCLTMPKQAGKDVGVFGDTSLSLQECKLLWAVGAIEKGYQFKGLVGVPI